MSDKKSQITKIHFTPELITETTQVDDVRKILILLKTKIKCVVFDINIMT